MNPYLPPASAQTLDDGILDLVRLGRITGASTAAAFVLLTSGWVMLEMKIFGPFLWVHGSVAMLVLVLSAIWGGGLVARQADGGWLRWCWAIVRVSLVCLLSGDLGLLLSSSALALARSQRMFQGLELLMNPREQAFMLGYGFLMAVSISASAGLFIRHHAQKQRANPLP